MPYSLDVFFLMETPDNNNVYESLARTHEAYFLLNIIKSSLIIKSVSCWLTNEEPLLFLEKAGARSLFF